MDKPGAMCRLVSSSGPTICLVAVGRQRAIRLMLMVKGRSWVVAEVLAKSKRTSLIDDELSNEGGTGSESHTGLYMLES